MHHTHLVGILRLYCQKIKTNCLSQIEIHEMCFWTKLPFFFFLQNDADVPTGMASLLTAPLVRKKEEDSDCVSSVSLVGYNVSGALISSVNTEISAFLFLSPGATHPQPSPHSFPLALTALLGHPASLEEARETKRWVFPCEDQEKEEPGGVCGQGGRWGWRGTSCGQYSLQSNNSYGVTSFEILVILLKWSGEQPGRW